MVENELQRKTRQAVEQMREMNMRASLNGNQKTDNPHNAATYVNICNYSTPDIVVNAQNPTYI